MAALLKKRALAQYCYSSSDEGPRPAKKLQIVKRSKPCEQWDFNLSAINITASPRDLLQSLLTLQQSFPIPTELRMEVLHKLVELLQEMNDSNKSDDIAKKCNPLQDIITSKLLSVIAEMSISQSSPLDIQHVMEKIIAVTSITKSNKVLAHAVQASHVIVKKRSTLKVYEQFLQLVLNLLSSSTSNHLVKVRCLEAAGGLCPAENGKLQSSIIETLTLHTSHQDNRVRTAAFKALKLVVEEQKISTPPELYNNVCSALTDDYQCVREAALSLIKILAENDPERMVPSTGIEDHPLRLVDHAFSHICNSINDVSIRVRTLAASLLGSLKGVSDYFLQQTLDKKIMSNMKRKCSAHERAKVMVSSGEWSTGKRWADDRPTERIEADEVQVINSGSCGAFVHGLEDEFLEVRNASLDSICTLASRNLSFANSCLDFLVDMFNDEIEEVRLKAIQVLQVIAHQIKLRSDQLDEILHALKDSWLDIRESLHGLLAICHLTTTSCITAAVSSLLDNLRRYPQDRRSIQQCLKQIGKNHPELVLALVPQLLIIHPYFDGVEPSVQDKDYICKLILVLNAAVGCPTILSLLEEHTLRHYDYLRDTMPQFVPMLKMHEQSPKEVMGTNTLNFLKESIEKILNLEQSKSPLRQNIYSAIHSDLIKLADIDPHLSAASNMAAIYIECMQVFTKIFSTRNWLTPSSLSVQQSGSLKTSVDLLLRNTLKLRYAFHESSPTERSMIRSMRVRTLALQLVYVVHGSTGSALGLCDNFLEHVESLHRELLNEDLAADAFTEALIQELSQLEEPRPGAVARILQRLLLAHNVPPLRAFENPSAMKMCWAEILEPSQDSEIIHKLSAGLVVGVALDAEIWHLEDTSSLRIRVTYPDHTNHLIIPSPSNLRPRESGCHRLLTTVLISAQVWSEACHVGISLVLDLSDQEALAGRKHLTSRADDAATTVPLCQPVKVLVWPKQIRKGV